MMFVISLQCENYPVKMYKHIYFYQHFTIITRIYIFVFAGELYAQQKVFNVVT